MLYWVFFFSLFVISVRYAEAERRRKEEAERRAKLDEIAEKQRQRELELEEKEKLRREAVLSRPTEMPARPSEPLTGGRPLEPGSAAPAAAAAAAAPAPGKYVPKFRRTERPESTGPIPPPESDRWGSRVASNPDPSDRWGRNDDRPPQPSSDRWRRDDRDRGSSFGSGGGSRSSTWSSRR